MPVSPTNQDRSSALPTLLGLALACAVITAWMAVHAIAVFALSWTTIGILATPILVAVQCWLSVGLFIVAHDCMHGLLAPKRPSVNYAIGQLCLALYAGFSFARLNAKHHEHHAFAGTDADPDYHAGQPPAFWPWFGGFMREYFGWREYVAITAMVVVYLVVTGADPTRVLTFWALPSILAALQLFYYGTYLPHRPGPRPFTDRHRTRSNEYSWAWSLITCFHFGYHHEHHQYPWLPWWRLPEARDPRPALSP